MLFGMSKTKVILLDAHMGTKGIFLARQFNNYEGTDDRNVSNSNDGLVYIRNTFKKDTKKWFHTDVCEGMLSNFCFIIMIN